jgi:hypothetical protein
MEADRVELLYRAQGSVGILDLLLGMEGDMKRYQQDVRDGKVKPLSEVPSGVVR